MHGRLEPWGEGWGAVGPGGAQVTERGPFSLLWATPLVSPGALRKQTSYIAFSVLSFFLFPVKMARGVK